MSTDDSFSPEVLLVASFLLLLSLVRYYLGLHSEGASEDVSDTASASESTSVGVGVLHKQRSGVDSNHDDDTSAVSDSSFGSRGRDSSIDITPSAPPTSNEYPYLLSHGPEQFTISSKQKLIDECGSYEESLQKGILFYILYLFYMIVFICMFCMFCLLFFCRYKRFLRCVFLSHIHYYV
jgi:hypothetical protein